MWKNNSTYDNDYHKVNIQRKGAGVSLSGIGSSEAADQQKTLLASV